QENGPMFHYLLSALLLSPLFIFKVINPLAIKTAISSLDAQESIYIAFRLVTLLFGVLTLITLIRIARKLKLNSAITLLFFALTPAWLSMSNYFKYDIAFVFWITLSV